MNKLYSLEKERRRVSRREIFNIETAKNIAISGISSFQVQRGYDLRAQFSRFLLPLSLDKEPFTVTHSVYSAMHLNVTLTVEMGLLYPPIAIWEDVGFNVECLQ